MRLKPVAAKFTLIAVLTSVISCGKPMPPAYSEMVGVWEGNQVRLSISSNSLIRYYKRTSGSTLKLNGIPIQELSDKEMVVGIGPFKGRFTIEQLPQSRKGVWYMTIDGDELMRTSR